MKITTFSLSLILLSTLSSCATHDSKNGAGAGNHVFVNGSQTIEESALPHLVTQAINQKYPNAELTMIIQFVKDSQLFMYFIQLRTDKTLVGLYLKPNGETQEVLYESDLGNLRYSMPYDYISGHEIPSNTVSRIEAIFDVSGMSETNHIVIVSKNEHPNQGMEPTSANAQSDVPED